MPLIDAAGQELPSYQAYLCLAWLVATGLLDRHGRTGYTARRDLDLAAGLEACWEALPKR